MGDWQNDACTETLWIKKLNITCWRSHYHHYRQHWNINLWSWSCDLSIRVTRLFNTITGFIKACINITVGQDIHSNTAVSPTIADVMDRSFIRVSNFNSFLLNSPTFFVSMRLKNIYESFIQYFNRCWCKGFQIILLCNSELTWFGWPQIFSHWSSGTPSSCP